MTLRTALKPPDSIIEKNTFQAEGIDEHFVNSIYVCNMSSRMEGCPIWCNFSIYSYQSTSDILFDLYLDPETLTNIYDNYEHVFGAWNGLAVLVVLLDCEIVF